MISSIDLEQYYAGVIHVHSRRSHDGHDSIRDMSFQLKKDGIDFCVLTDHFEDFNAETFKEYIQDIEAVNRRRQTIFVPAVEAEYRQFHIIFFPVSRYEAVREIVSSRLLRKGSLVQILAHPTKYPVWDVLDFLRSNHLDGLEVWNQQADGNYAPPARYIRTLLTDPAADPGSVFFGTDVHNMKYRINNLLLIRRDGPLSPRMVVDALKKKAFMNYSRATGRSLQGSSNSAEVRAWLGDEERQHDLRTRLLSVARKILKFHYNLLPRPARRLVNDLKNTIRSKL